MRPSLSDHPRARATMALKISRGFTLIELMIVIAIIGILAAIAIPAYRDYVAKAQAGEAIVLLMGKKVPMAEFFNTAGRWPGDVASVADQGSSGNYIATVAITSGEGSTGVVELTAHVRTTDVSTIIAGRNVIMTSSDGSHWTCKSNDIPSRILPAACR